MSAVIDDGGPAYPTENDNKYWIGMTLRDYFAGQALAGIMGNPDHQDAMSTRPLETHGAAKHAYLVADAMLTARKGGPQS